MAILSYEDLVINGQTVSYEGPLKITPGTIKRVPNPQVNGPLIYNPDISENRAQIIVNQRVHPESNDLFDEIYANGDNNTVSIGDKNYTRVALEMIPEREDKGTVDYVLFAEPSI